MSYILYHPGEERDINLTSGGFRQCLDFACVFGWKPTGTVDPSDDSQIGWDPKRAAANGLATILACVATRWSWKMMRARLAGLSFEVSM